MSLYPTNSDDVIDSRDVISRIEELESEQEVLAEAVSDAKAELTDLQDDQYASKIKDEDALGMARDNLASAEDELDAFDDSELVALQQLQDGAEGYSPDWKDGATLVRESYFVEYCQELLKDIGELPKDLPSYIEIDWDKTAENLKVDYTECDFDGITYLVR